MIKKDLRAKQKYSFWVTNVTKKNVCLSDLALTIPAGRSMNLLDQKHFYYTLEQLHLSVDSGSIYSKRDKIKISDNPPVIPIKPGIYLSKEPRYAPPRSSIKIEEKIYEELVPDTDQLVSEEKFALEYVEEINYAFKKQKT